MGLSGSAIVPVATYTADVYPPAAGTPVLAADVEAGEQAFANRWEWLLAQPRVVEVVRYSATDPSEAHAQLGVDFTSNTFTDSTVILATSIANVATNDVIKIDGQFIVSRAVGAGTPGALRMRCGTAHYCTDSIPLVPVGALDGVDAGYVVTISGTYTVLSSQAGGPITLTLQARKGDTDIKILRPSNFTATVYRTGV
jgi:hypothetical protein